MNLNLYETAYKVSITIVKNEKRFTEISEWMTFGCANKLFNNKCAEIGLQYQPWLWTNSIFGSKKETYIDTAKNGDDILFTLFYGIEFKMTDICGNDCYKVFRESE